jgi:hypothetical protein
MLSDSEARARAQQDFELTLPVLWKHMPEGWDQRTNPDTVNIASPTECVLAQEFGSWEDGVRYLKGRGVMLESVPSLIYPEHLDANDRYKYYRFGTAIWRDWLLERRKLLMAA